jgi:hypothetical protein
VQVRFGGILAEHLRRSSDPFRARFLPAAELAVRHPVEVWEWRFRRYYLARFQKPDGALGFVVVTARRGEQADEVITMMPKAAKQIERLRRGKLLYALETAS